MFEASVMIVAHPDDDILWLGSVVHKVDGIVFCFNDDPCNPLVGQARRKTIQEYPLENVSTLGVLEPLSLDKADWSDLIVTDYGIKLVKSQDANERYLDTFEKLLHDLKIIVADKKNVFTHNPWGEYGHEEHVLVYHVLKTLQHEFHFDLWYSNYCSNRSISFMTRYISGFDAAYECLPVNLSLVSEIVEIYKRNDCWTWYDDYQWFDSECLIRQKPGGEQYEKLPYGRSFPLNYIKILVGSEEPRPSRFAQTLSRLKRKLVT